MKKNRSHCPINYSLEIFGDKWTLLIIRDLVFLKKETYCELKSSSEKISTNILADRLKLLESEGIVTKQVSPRDSKVFLYNLTQKGLDLIPVMLEMILWGAKYDPQTAAPPAIIKEIRNDRKALIEEIIAAIKDPDANIFNL